MQLPSGGLSEAAIFDDQVDQRQHLGRGHLAPLAQLLQSDLERRRICLAQQQLALSCFAFQERGDKIEGLGH
jgi:hypothetical protein